MKTRGLNIPCIVTVEDVLSHSYGVNPIPKITAPVLPTTVTRGKDISVEPVHLEQDISVEPDILTNFVDTEPEPEPELKPVKPSEPELKPKRIRKR